MSNDRDVEESYPVKNFDMRVALYYLRKGKKVARAGWNGKNMFIYYVPAGAYEPYTEIAKELVNEDGKVPYAPYVAMKTVDGTVVPWLCSQTDLLAEDWMIVG